MNNVPPDPAPLFAPFLARAEAAEAEAASLRADLAAERAAHHKALDAYATLLREVDAERARADAGASACEVGLRNQLGLERELTAARADLAAAEREADRWRHGLPVEGDYVCPTAQERDAAIARAERAERERDDLRARLLSEADASRASIASLGGLVESSAARAEKAEGERDEARAACAAMREAIESDPNWRHHKHCDSVCSSRHSAYARILASDAGAPLLAEVRALRAVRDAAETFVAVVGTDSRPSARVIAACEATAAALLKARDVAKGGG